MNGARRTPSGPFAPVHEDYASGAGDRQEDQDAVGRHEQKLMVFLLTGLSGGTARRFLDIAYIVRGIIERDHGSAGIDRVNTLGYLFTPDINLANKSLSEHTREYIKKNGYAALKELDYWMNVDARGERFKQTVRQHSECEFSVASV